MGGSGCGKTAIIEQLVNGSTLHLASGDRGEDGNLCKGGPSMTSVEGHGAVQSGTSPGGMVGVGVDPSSTGGTSPSLMRLAGQVVAWHFCQTSDSATCMVPEFVHSLASYLAIAPQLGSYRCLMAEVGASSFLSFSLFVSCALCLCEGVVFTCVVSGVLPG